MTTYRAMHGRKYDVPATEKQKGYLRAFHGGPGIDEMTKREASALITLIKGFDEDKISESQHGRCAYCTTSMHEVVRSDEEHGNVYSFDFRMHRSCAEEHVAALWDDSENTGSTTAFRKDRAKRAAAFGARLDADMDFVRPSWTPVTICAYDGTITGICDRPIFYNEVTGLWHHTDGFNDHTPIRSTT